MPDHREGTSAADEARKAADEAKSAASEEAQSFRDNVEEEVSRRAGDTRDTLAGEVGEFGEALRSASGKLRRGSPQEQLVTSAANAMEEFSSHVRGRDLGELLEEVNTFGRRNPAAFLGGAALLGFAGMRLAKASQRRRPIEHDEGHGAPDPAPAPGSTTRGPAGTPAGTGSTAPRPMPTSTAPGAPGQSPTGAPTGPGSTPGGTAGTTAGGTAGTTPGTSPTRPGTSIERTKP
ncbi:hypothetical protein [Pseudooceanicola sp.]|uniref:hypothetical protein n=1 Tax=Pseudooceanicola sp. TaxID=1914328 RepID=UPI003514C681